MKANFARYFFNPLILTHCSLYRSFDNRLVLTTFDVKRLEGLQLSFESAGYRDALFNGVLKAITSVLQDMIRYIVTAAITVVINVELDKINDKI